MMTNTALGAKTEQSAHTVTFKNDKHEKFYLEYLQKCRYQDVYHKALVYRLGISDDTRKCIWVSGGKWLSGVMVCGTSGRTGRAGKLWRAVEEMDIRKFTCHATAVGVSD